MGVLAFMMTFVVGFFATAGAAGVDFGTNSRDRNDVQMGGLVGVALAIIVTAGISLLVVAGTYGSPDLSKAAVAAATDAAAKTTPPGTELDSSVARLDPDPHGQERGPGGVFAGAGGISGGVLLGIYCGEQF